MERIVALVLLIFSTSAYAGNPIAIGSKTFTEGYLMGELLAQTLEIKGFEVERRFGLGGTGIVYEALKKGEIDMYVEYTGTIAEAILKRPELDTLDQISDAIMLEGLAISRPLGFANNYGIAVKREFSEIHSLERISDLISFSEPIRGVFSHEFVNRKDGLRGLQAHYGSDLVRDITSMEHSLAYQAIANDKADLIEVYTTDAKIQSLDLVILKDDQKFFPNYQAVILTREDFLVERPLAWETLENLEGSLNESNVQKLNGAVDLDKKSFSETISAYIGNNQMLAKNQKLKSVFKRTKEHGMMVLVTLFLSMIIGIPLGVLANDNQKLGQGIVLVSSLFQTVPSLALLCFLIPLFGIGTKSALVALFLYGLLPIVVSTTSGLRSVDQKLLEVADTLGFSRWQRLMNVGLPLASPQILTGVRTAAIITIATATLAALIGAGGYGVPIVRGLAINDMNVVLLGAVPAAGMAIVTHFLFELFERLIIPKPLRGN